MNGKARSVLEPSSFPILPYLYPYPGFFTHLTLPQSPFLT